MEWEESPLFFVYVLFCRTRKLEGKKYCSVTSFLFCPVFLHVFLFFPFFSSSSSPPLHSSSFLHVFFLCFFSSSSLLSVFVLLFFLILSVTNYSYKLPFQTLGNSINTGYQCSVKEEVSLPAVNTALIMSAFTFKPVRVPETLILTSLVPLIWFLICVPTNLLFL